MEFLLLCLDMSSYYLGTKIRCYSDFFPLSIRLNKMTFLCICLCNFSEIPKGLFEYPIPQLIKAEDKERIIHETSTAATGFMLSCPRPKAICFYPCIMVFFDIHPYCCHL